jgi:hypothetical protein
MRCSSAPAVLLGLVIVGCGRAPAPPSHPPGSPAPRISPAPTVGQAAAVPDVPPETPDSSGVYRYLPGGAITQPVELSRVSPNFPERFRHTRITQPLYIYECVITETGTIQRLRLLRGRVDKEPYISIERAFRESIPQWRYRPATLNGRPVPVWLTITATVEVR